MPYKFGQPEWMNALQPGTDVVGYVIDGAMVHADCFTGEKDSAGAVFAFDEGSSNETCDNCLKRFRDH